MRADGYSGAWSRGMLERVSRCPACGGAPQPLSFERRDNDARMPDRWRMLRCATCGSLWPDPRPDCESLPRACESYYTHDAEAEDIPHDGARGLEWRLIHGYLNRRFGMHRRPSSTLGYLLFSLVEPWRLKLDYYGRHLCHTTSLHVAGCWTLVVATVVSCCARVTWAGMFVVAIPIPKRQRRAALKAWTSLQLMDSTPRSKHRASTW